MAELVKCFECGKSISSSVSSCLNCNTAFPHGELCVVCEIRGRASELVRKEIDSIYTHQYRYFHSHCLNAVLNTDARCETCGEPLVPLLKAECRNCGQRQDAPSCHYCRQPVHSNATDFRSWHEWNSRYDSMGEFIAEGASLRYAHALCSATGNRQEYQRGRQASADEYSAARQQEEALQAEKAAEQERIKNEKLRRVRNKCCPICGQGFSQSFLSQLFSQSNPERRERDPHLREECSIHERCRNRTFQE